MALPCECEKEREGLFFNHENMFTVVPHILFHRSDLQKDTTLRPWRYILSCFSRLYTPSVTQSSPGNGYLWRSPSRFWAHMPRLKWVMVSAGQSLTNIDYAHMLKLVFTSFQCLARNLPLHRKHSVPRGHQVICCTSLTDPSL